MSSSAAGSAAAVVPEQQQQQQQQHDEIMIGTSRRIPNKNHPPNDVQRGRGREGEDLVLEEVPIWGGEEVASSRLLRSDSYYDDGKYHPGKDDYDCEDYSQSTSSDEEEGGGGNGGNNNRHLRRQGDWFFGGGRGDPDLGEMVPCRDHSWGGGGPPPDPIMPAGGDGFSAGGPGQGPPSSSSSGGGNMNSNNDPASGQPPPPPPPPPLPSSSSMSPVYQELARSTIVLNISLAIPNDHKDGIPRIITTVIKDYLRENNVTLTFLDYEYDNNQHFLLNVWKPPRLGPPGSGLRIESPSEEEEEEEEENNNNNNNDDKYNNNNNNDDKYNNNNNNDGNNRRLPEETPIPLDNNVTTSLYPDTTVLGLIAHRAEKGNFIGNVTNSNYVWVSHTVYLVAHEDDKNHANNATSSAGVGGYIGSIAANYLNINYTKQTLVKDMNLMSWLQEHLQEIVYQDIDLTGPVGPYFDSNNYKSYHNTHQQISYIEWNIQRYGIPVAGVAKPGKEKDYDLPIMDMEEMGMYSSDEEIFDGAALPPGDAAAESSLHPPHDKIRNFTDPLDRNYMGPRQWLGVTCLICTVVFTSILAIVSNEISKRREQEEMWGNLKILEMAQEDVDYLNVGWRFADANAATTGGAVGGGDGGNNNNNNPKMTENMMMMEVFDKRGLGYREGDSMLMGGYEYKPNNPLGASTVGQGQQQPDASTFPKTNSYRVDPSVTPFG